MERTGLQSYGGFASSGGRGEHRDFHWKLTHLWQDDILGDGAVGIHAPDCLIHASGAGCIGRGKLSGSGVNVRSSRATLTCVPGGKGERKKQYFVIVWSVSACQLGYIEAEGF